ncbi:predicted protein [Plenodomus lingam JN3]|uniref:Uncharacterized protein n=1 Tax=Leptosphaeria maculans (strain JN3 / isolate v23.1.3 / race Av1-4-5-6-7-8) TaxID=985895 RepID=E5A5Z6_LEPMJ|nr:predicted protein [Plenodomus lingam JN3]CBX99041.1 predicted protein [Plenodomus lingam JN3]
MHLDERLDKSRELIGKQLAAGQQKVSSAYNKLWAEMEAMREAQRKRQEEARAAAAAAAAAGDKEGGGGGAQKCAYFSSWGTWASEKRRGWASPKMPVHAGAGAGSPVGVGAKEGGEAKEMKQWEMESESESERESETQGKQPELQGEEEREQEPATEQDKHDGAAVYTSIGMDDDDAGWGHGGTAASVVWDAEKEGRTGWGG